jgi:hypothetical protein
MYRSTVGTVPAPRQAGGTSGRSFQRFAIFAPTAQTRLSSLPLARPLPSSSADAEGERRGNNAINRLQLTVPPLRFFTGTLLSALRAQVCVPRASCGVASASNSRLRAPLAHSPPPPPQPPLPPPAPPTTLTNTGTAVHLRHLAPNCLCRPKHVHSTVHIILCTHIDLTTHPCTALPSAAA